MPPPRRVLACALSLLPCAAAAAQRQGQIELTPFIGLYYATANIIDESDPLGDITITFDQQVSSSFGARAALWLGDRMAVEATFAYTPSEVEVAVESGSERMTQSEGARVIAASGRIRYQFGLPTAEKKHAFHAVGGVALVARGGRFWDELQSFGARVHGLTDIGAVLGGGLDLSAGTGRVLRIAVEDYVHQAKFTLDDGSLGSAGHAVPIAARPRPVDGTGLSAGPALAPRWWSQT